MMEESMSMIEVMIMHLKNYINNALRIQSSETLSDDTKAQMGDMAVEYVKRDVIVRFTKEWEKNKIKFDEIKHRDGRQTDYTMDYIVIHREQWNNLVLTIKHLITQVEHYE